MRNVLKNHRFGPAPAIFPVYLSGALRGAGDTVWPLIATIVGVLLVRVVIAYVLVKWYHLGLSGAWIGILVDQVIRWLLIVRRHASGDWTTIRLH